MSLATTGGASGFEPIRIPSLVDGAHQQIRTQILSGELRPGDPLRDSVLAERMGISRSPVREALRLLEQSGLVEKSANRSYRISMLAAADVPELAALRAADEVIAVRTIVAKRIDISALDAPIARMRAASSGVELAAADTDFHATVVALAGLPRLTARYADLSDQIRLVLLAGGLEQEHTHALITENHTVARDALARAIASQSTDEIVGIWEHHVLIGMTVPDLFAPRDRAL